MEILNCQYANHQIFKRKEEYKEKDLGALIFKIQENFFDIEDDIDNLYNLENMKIYQVIFGDRSIFGGKNISQIVERAELIKIVCQQIVNEKTYSLNFKKNNKKLKIDYLCLESIANVIKKMLSNIIDKNDFPHLLDDIIEKKNFSKVLSSEIWGMPLKQIKMAFNQVEEISFHLSGNNDDEFDIKYILLLYYFFKILFPNVNSITINFDILKIIKQYNELKNPYDFKDKKAKEISTNFDNLFLSNFLIACIIALSTDTLNLNKLKVKASESYINENYYIISKEFTNKTIKEKIIKEKGFILFKKLMKIKTMTKLSFSINCLDRFLFKDVINFIALRQTIKSLELNLFFNPKFYNQRKILLNYIKGQEFHEIDPNVMDKHGIVYFPYIYMLGEDIQTIIEEEKIPDLLYPEFKKNLTYLKIILNQYIITYKEFSLDITPYEELTNYENYNVQILLFILTILFTLENSKEIESLILKCSNFEYAYVLQILKKVNKIITPKLIDLSKCDKLKNLTLDIQGITLLLDFSLLPLDSLQKLDISMTALKDMEKLLEFFQNHKNDFKNLTQLNLSFLLTYDVHYALNAFLKIFDNLPPCIKILNINNENMMKKEDVLEIIKKIQKHENFVNCEFKCDCLDLEEFLNSNKIEELKKFLNSKGKINIDKCEIIRDEFKRINLSLISSPSQDIIKSIIYCVKKIKNNNEETKKDDNIKIFSKILKFIGKRQNFEIILN